MATRLLCPQALPASFLALLPRIELHGLISFRHVKCPHRKEEALQEMRALAWAWYLRLARRGKDAGKFPSAIATFAARAVRSGRRVCGQERAKEALSPLAQRRRGIVVASLPESSTLNGNAFDEALQDNRKTPVPDQVAFRFDFPAWLGTLGRRNRKIAWAMALGFRTHE